MSGRAVEVRISATAAQASAGIALVAVLAAAALVAVPGATDPAAVLEFGDGPAVAFAMPDGGSATPATVWLSTADGSRGAPLAVGHGPLISPDGTLVAFARRAHGGSGLWVVDRRGRERRLYGPESILDDTEGGLTQPVWSPDSRELAFLAETPGHAPGARLVVVRADGSGTRVVAEGRFRPGGQLVFSPRGDRIAFTTATHDRADVLVADVASGRIVRVPLGNGNRRRGSPLLWREPGLAFTFLEPAEGRPRGDVWLYDGGRRLRRLTRLRASMEAVAWSRDGRQLLAWEPGPGYRNRLWLISTSTGDARPLTRRVRDLYGQGFSADGRWVLAGVGCGRAVHPLGRLERIAVGDGSRQVVARGPCRGSWSR